MEAMDGYLYHKAARALHEFIVEDLSRWYVRLIRSRTWREKEDIDKLAAYFTLHYALVRIAKLIAPLMPYLSEEIFLNLSEGKESVHLEAFPDVDDGLISPELENEMAYVRKIVDACANARQKAEVKQRWPVPEVVIETDDPAVDSAIRELRPVLLEQVNTKDIRTGRVERTYAVRPNFKALGPRYKGDAKKVADAIEATPDEEIVNGIMSCGTATAGAYEITREDVVLEERMPHGWQSSETDVGIVFVNTQLDEQLRSEAMARELIRRIQEMRKQLDLNVEDMIKTWVSSDFDELVARQRDYIATETRSASLVFERGDTGFFKEWDIDGNTAHIWIESEA
jgi:isoleucyl-tRNA synthetase